MLNVLNRALQEDLRREIGIRKPVGTLLAREFAVRSTFAAALSRWLGKMEVEHREKQLMSCHTDWEPEDISRYLIASIQDSAIFMLDGAGRVASWNSGAERILGFSASEIIGRHFSCFYPEEDVRANLPQLELERAAANGSASAEGWRVRRNGVWFWGSGVIHSMKNQGLRGFVTVLRDLTERKLAEDRLRDETQIAETLHRIGAILAAELDFEKLLRKVTDAARMLTHAEIGALLYHEPKSDQRADILCTMSRSMHATVEVFPLPISTDLFEPGKTGKTSLRVDDVWTHEQFRTLDPPSPIRSFLAVPIVSRAGVLLGGMFFGHSSPRRFTERDERLLVGIAGQAAVAIDNARLYQQAQAMSRELKHQNEELEEADRRKNEFLAMLGHELRNPLAPIVNALHIIRNEQNTNSIVRQAANIAERQVRQLTTLVDDLVDVGRITRGTIQLHRERIKLADVLTRAVESVQPMMDAQQHSFSVSYPRHTIWWDGDPVRLQQVFTNLLENAAKYTPRGGHVILNAQLERDETIISVKDNGTGIAPDLLGKVFDLFTQAERSLARSEGGLGLGLTMVRRLVEMHGGSVEARSAGVGHGSEFIVRLPVLHEVSEPSHHVRPSRQEERGTSSRVLVVDDNIDAAHSMAMMLRAYGHQVVGIAHEGSTALQMILDEQPDTVMLDIGLPAMDGYEVAQRVRSDPRNAKIRLIAVTGYGLASDRQRSRECGFDEHLVKPVHPDQLLAALRHDTNQPAV